MKKSPSNDWAKFKQVCSNFTLKNTISSVEEINSEKERLNKRVKSAYHKATIISSDSNRTISHIPEVQQIIRERNKARRKFQRTNNPLYSLQRNMLSHQIQKIINQHKIKAWKNKISGLNLQDQFL